MAATRAKLNLATLKAKHAPPPPPPESEPVASGNGELRRGQTLRLKPAAWTQLKILAAEQGKTSHDLRLETPWRRFDPNQ